MVVITLYAELAFVTLLALFKTIIIINVHLLLQLLVKILGIHTLPRIPFPTIL